MIHYAKNRLDKGGLLAYPGSRLPSAGITQIRFQGLRVLPRSQPSP